MAPVRHKPSGRRRRTIAFAALCAGVVAIAAVTPFADAGNTKAKVIGQVKHNPKPLCPQKPAENQNPPVVKRPCFVIGSVTGFQLKADGKHHIMRATKTGKLVAWAVKLGKPNKTERNTFGSMKFFGSKKYGKEPTGRISIIAPKKHGKFKLIRQSPTVQLGQAAGELHYITLNKPLKIKKGQILALTTQTWIPSLITTQYAPQSSWRASRAPKKCGNGKALDARPQTKVGSIRDYGCIFTARLMYWGYYVPGK
jgi:hypothetical protein